ncbi:Peptidase C39 family [Cardiobacterium valvarum]|uniref:Peptidase C39 family n=1 Tax=Cardiobacterium valvarum TaxID=194702 RepID=A0A381ECR6_9GAMM|nr:Peptidase C39 family [Cardiobacterium valvarum]
MVHKIQKKIQVNVICNIKDFPSCVGKVLAHCELDQTRQQILQKKDKELEQLQAQREAGTISESEYQRRANDIHSSKRLIDGGLRAITAPGGVPGAAMGFVQPYAAQWIKENTSPGSFAHVGGHFALGALNALANGGSGTDAALSGAGAAGAEMAIPQLAQRLYGTSDPDKLTAEQKANLKAAAALFGTAVGGAGGNAVNAANAGSAAENAVGNNWLSTSQLIDIDKRYHDCGTDERCKQDVIYTAQLISHSQDTDLTVAKVKCFFTYCDTLDQYIGERVKAADLNIAYKELKKYYPNATEEDLRKAAKYYSDEAVRSFDTSTGRTLIGALDASPAVGLAGSGVREATSAIKQAFKNGAARAALRNAEVTAAEAASREAVLNSAAHGSPTAKELASIKNVGSEKVAGQAEHPLLQDKIPRTGKPDRPVVNQGPHPTCGHNCAHMVLKTKNKSVAVNELIHQIPPSPKGISSYKVEALLKNNGVKAQAVSRRKLDDIVRYTKTGNPVIVRIKNKDFSHFIVVDGVTTRGGPKLLP